MDKKVSETPFIAAISVALAAMLCVVVADTAKISVTRMPLKVVTLNDFDPNNPTNNKRDAFEKKIDPDASAVTNWDFASGCKMDYELESQEQSSDSWLVRLRIKRVHVTLSLPIQIHLPKETNEKIEKHERGHVEICKRIYDEGASESARKAAEAIMLRKFGGEGKTAEEACAQALNTAAAELAEQYQAQTLRVADDVSEIYDFLQRKEGETPDSSVKKAFEIYHNGGPRRISLDSIQCF